MGLKILFLGRVSINKLNQFYFPGKYYEEMAK